MKIFSCPFHVAGRSWRLCLRVPSRYEARIFRVPISARGRLAKSPYAFVRFLSWSKLRLDRPTRSEAKSETTGPTTTEKAKSARPIEALRTPGVYESNRTAGVRRPRLLARSCQPYQCAAENMHRRSSAQGRGEPAPANKRWTFPDRIFSRSSAVRKAFLTLAITPAGSLIVKSEP